MRVTLCRPPAKSETRWTQSVFFFCYIDQGNCQGQSSPGAQSVIPLTSQQTIKGMAMWQGGVGNGGCLTLCWSLTCSVDCIFVLLQGKRQTFSKTLVIIYAAPVVYYKSCSPPLILGPFVLTDLVDFVLIHIDLPNGFKPSS